MWQLYKGETMTNKEYHERPEISKSDLDLIAKSTLHYKQNEFKEQTPSLLLGSITHKLVLEPELFDNEYAVAPPFTKKRTKAGKEKYAEFEAKTVGKEIITADVYDTAKTMADMVLGMKESANFLRDGLAEQSYFSKIDDVEVKCRPEFYNEKQGIIVDLKTTADASLDGFTKSVANFNYHMQAAFYSDILISLNKEVRAFLFIAVETKAPHYVGFYHIDVQGIELGRERYKKLLKKYKKCRDENMWYGYCKLDDSGELQPIQELSLPTWKFYEEII